MAWWAFFGAIMVTAAPPTPPPPVTASMPPVVTTTPGTVTPGSVPASVSASTSSGATDPLGCDALVYDPSGELDHDEVTAAATSVAGALHADLHVRAERDLDGGLDARMAQLVAQCPTWSSPSGIDRADALVVVMYSSTEREASVFYGPGLSSRLQYRWEHAVDEMGPRFAAGDYTAGVTDGLRALQTDAPVSYQPSYSPTAYGDSSSSSAGVPPAMWLLLVLIVGVAAVRVAKFATTGEWSSNGDGAGSSRRSGSSGPTSSWRSSSHGSTRSFSSGSRSSGSRSSGSRSSGRSGGGTKKW